MFVNIDIKDENLAKPFLTLYGLEDTEDIVVSLLIGNDKFNSYYF